MVHFEVDSKSLNQLVLNVVATEKQAAKALRSTLNKMAAWLRVRGVKGLSKELAMQQKILRRRLKAVKFKTAPDGGTAKIWFGLNRVSLMTLGAKKTSTGVSASGGRTVAGAFIAKANGGKQQVFKRRGSARLPIDKQMEKIQKPAEAYIAGGLLGSSEFEQQFWKTFEHELQWQTR